jgi:hypothetical protein
VLLLCTLIDALSPGSLTPAGGYGLDSRRGEFHAS